MKFVLFGDWGLGDVIIPFHRPHERDRELSSKVSKHRKKGQRHMNMGYPVAHHKHDVRLDVRRSADVFGSTRWMTKT